MSRPRPAGVCESVPGGLWRIEAPGGWIYATAPPGDPHRTITFVPSPPVGGLPVAPPRPADSAGLPQPDYGLTRTTYR